MKGSEYMKVTAQENINRGDIVWVDFGEYNGSIQGGIRPAIVLQNNMGNYHSPTVIVAKITSQHKKENLPTHIPVRSNETGLRKDSVILLEQIMTINKFQVLKNIGQAANSALKRVDNAAKISLALQ